MQPRRRRIPPEVALNTQLFIPTLAVCLATGILLERLTWSKPDRTPATEAPRRERATEPTPRRCVPAEAADAEIGPLREEIVAIEDEYEAMFGPEPSFEGAPAAEQPDEARRRLQEIADALQGTVASVDCSEHPCIGVLLVEGAESEDVSRELIASVADAFSLAVPLGKASWSETRGYIVTPLGATSDDIRQLRRLHYRMSFEDEIARSELQEAP